MPTGLKRLTMIEWVFLSGLGCIIGALITGRYWLALYIFSGLLVVLVLLILLALAADDPSHDDWPSHG